MDEVDICRLSLNGVATAIRSKELSSREVTEAILTHVGSINPSVCAYTELHWDSALMAASASDNYIAAGYLLGPLHGVPIALKDLIWEQHVSARSGSKILGSFVPSEDATVTKRLRQAGAIFVGRLNMHELAYGITTVNPHFGTSRNPWNTARLVGGSSGGSAAAVAAGMCYGALGTDTGCSVRLPAALNGVVGLRPTLGRVSLFGVEPLVPSMDTVGPLARSVKDCATLFSVIDGGTSRDHPSSSSVLPHDNSDLVGIRVATIRELSVEALADYMQSSLDRSLATLEGLGANLSEVSVSDLSHRISALITVTRTEASSYHGESMRDERSQLYGEDVLQRLDLGEFELASHYVQAQRYRELLRRQLESIFASGIDCIVMPTVPFEAPPIDSDMSGSAPNDLSIDYGKGALTFNSLASLTGFPSLSVPIGFGPDGLPLAMQLMGPTNSETSLFQVAQSYEEAGSAYRFPAIPF